MSDLDLFDAAFYDEPAEAYRWLRDESPVYHDTINDIWALSRYSDVVWAEKNAQLLSSANGSRPWAGSMRPGDAEKLPLLEGMKLLQGGRRRQMMINEDDPKHQQMRSVFASLFTPRAVASHEQKVRATVRQLLHEVTPRGACDFAQDVAAQLPVIVIGDLMGYPPDDRRVLLRCADQGNLLGTGPGLRYVSRDGIEAINNFAEATMRLLAERRKAPKDDLISRLAGARLEGDLLDDTEIFNEMLLLNDGGADTTRYVITGGIVALLEHRDQLEAAKKDPSTWPAVVDECLRWVTPIVNMCRTANDDIELAGRKIKKGDWVALLYGAANSDERAFPEPYRFVVNRSNRHVAFGFGTHFCLGAHLARLEVRVMFEELFNRFPDLEISGPPRVSPTAFVRGIDHLPVSLGRPAQAA